MHADRSQWWRCERKRSPTVEAKNVQVSAENSEKSALWAPKRDISHGRTVKFTYELGKA